VWIYPKVFLKALTSHAYIQEKSRRDSTWVTPGCNPVEKRNHQSTIPEAAGFEKAKDYIEGMCDDFWKRNQAVEQKTS